MNDGHRHSAAPAASPVRRSLWPATRYLPLQSRLAIDALVSELPKCLDT
jgi:hypothetical protein